MRSLGLFRRGGKRGEERAQEGERVVRIAPNVSPSSSEEGAGGWCSIAVKGFVAAGEEYAVDCIIYASGFEVGTPFERRNGLEITGRAWEGGMKSKRGIHVHGFPKLFFVQPIQGANLISNVPHNLVESGRTIAAIVAHAEEQGASEVEVTAEAQQVWLDLLLAGPARMLGSPDCTPG